MDIASTRPILNSKYLKEIQLVIRSATRKYVSSSTDLCEDDIKKDGCLKSTEFVVRALCLDSPVVDLVLSRFTSQKPYAAIVFRMNSNSETVQVQTSAPINFFKGSVFHGNMVGDTLMVSSIGMLSGQRKLQSPLVQQKLLSSVFSEPAVISFFGDIKVVGNTMMSIPKFSALIRTSNSYNDFMFVNMKDETHKIHWSKEVRVKMLMFKDYSLQCYEQGQLVSAPSSMVIEKFSTAFEIVDSVCVLVALTKNEKYYNCSIVRFLPESFPDTLRRINDSLIKVHKQVPIDRLLYLLK
jgi:hypothetical protein